VNQDHEKQRERLVDFIRTLQERQFFGKVEVDIQAGNILRVVKTESIKLEDQGDEAPQRRGP